MKLLLRKNPVNVQLYELECEVVKYTCRLLQNKEENFQWRVFKSTVSNGRLILGEVKMRNGIKGVQFIILKKKTIFMSCFKVKKNKKTKQCQSRNCLSLHCLSTAGLQTGLVRGEMPPRPSSPACRIQIKKKLSGNTAIAAPTLWTPPCLFSIRQPRYWHEHT